MATNKTITVKQYNGTDYDTLYFKTIAEQVDGVYSKEQVLSSATAALFGLTSAALPDDVLAEIGKYKQYWWRRRLPAGLNKVPKYTNISNTVQLIPASTYNPGDKVIQVSDVVNVNQSTGAVSLMNPENFTIISTSDTTVGLQNCQALVAKAPCYISGVINQDSNVYYLPVGSTAGVNQGYKEDGSWEHDPSTTTVTLYGRSGEFYQILDNPTTASGAPYAQLVTYEEKTVSASDWQYIQSSDRNAYPDSGTQDGYEYEYLGVPFDNAVTAPKIETGSYVGTGTYGADNPNTLTFGFVPKLVMIYDGSTDYAMFFAFGIGKEYALGTYLLANSTELSTSSESYAKVNGDILNWYTSNTTSSRAPRYQFNIYQTTYYYFAIG